MYLKYCFCNSGSNIKTCGLHKGRTYQDCIHHDKTFIYVFNSSNIEVYIYIYIYLYSTSTISVCAVSFANHNGVIECYTFTKCHFMNEQLFVYFFLYYRKVEWISGATNNSCCLKFHSFEIVFAYWSSKLLKSTATTPYDRYRSLWQIYSFCCTFMFSKLQNSAGPIRINPHLRLHIIYYCDHIWFIMIFELL